MRPGQMLHANFIKVTQYCIENRRNRFILTRKTIRGIPTTSVSFRATFDNYLRYIMLDIKLACA